MNYLAHLYLGGNAPESMIGAMMGDFVKGSVGDGLPPAISEGIRLHRRIDTFTDAHPTFRTSKRRIAPEYRRYAGILIDLSFDHFLSKHWQNYSDIPLAEFNSRVYHTLQTQQHTLSEGSRRMLARMVDHDILGLYLDWETVPASAARIGQRFRRGNPLADVNPQLNPARNMLEEAFLEFYPELSAFCANHDSVLNLNGGQSSKIALNRKSP